MPSSIPGSRRAACNRLASPVASLRGKFRNVSRLNASQFLRRRVPISSHSFGKPTGTQRASTRAGVPMTIDPKEFKDSYEEYARKMDLFMDGPTTTQFQQLREAGIELPEPDSIPDADLRTKLWEVIAGLEKLRAFLHQTNHLDDRALYSKLWHEVLRVETPAVDEIGFSTEIDLVRLGED